MQMDHDVNFNETCPTTGAGNHTLEPFSVGSGRTRVKLDLQFQGRDFLLLVTGGKAHVGAVAVCDGREPGSRAAVTELPGHREGPLAGECAEILGHTSGRTVAVVAGIHQDHATKEEIAAILANVRQGIAALARIVTSDGTEPEDIE